MTVCPWPVIVDTGTASMALGEPGEGEESGDLHVVVATERGALVAAIDGLGHGSEAARASRAAAAVLVAHAALPVTDLVVRCHEALRSTRGAVMSLAQFCVATSSINWIGVGNVEGMLLRGDRSDLRREEVPARPGVVGFKLPPLRAGEVSVSRGDTLIMVTDGIRGGFAQGLALERSPQEIAESILDRHNKRNDDALVLVVRYQGGAP